MITTMKRKETSLVIPKELHYEMKKHAVNSRLQMKELTVKAITSYLTNEKIRVK